MTSSSNQSSRDHQIKRPVVSDLDDTHQGRLAFCISVFGGSVLAAALVPGALTSCWVWFTLLMASTAVALRTQNLFAQDSKEEVE